MLTTLQTAYSDTRAADLAWMLGGSRCPPWRSSTSGSARPTSR